LRVFVATLLAVLAAAIPSAGRADPPIQVFLLAGQSNMLGRALPNSDGTGPTAHLLLWRDGAWGPASDPLGPPDNPNNGVGPGMTFGVGVLGHEPAGTDVGLIMCAESSTPIGAWRPGKKPYDNCKSQARAAGGEVAGIVFLQGEYEAANRSGNHWRAQFAKVEPAFQKDYGPVPFVLVQIGNIDPGHSPQAQQVRDAQAAADAQFPQVTMVTSIDLPLQPDGIHFTVASQKTLGSRCADAWYTLQQQFPDISGVGPGQGAPGTSVTITGKGFSGVSDVEFGQANASFTVDDPTHITATVPDTGRTGPVSVTTPYGTATGPDFSVLPLITSLSPTSGPPGSKVFVNGKALARTTAVTLNGAPAKFKVVSGNQLKVWVEQGATSGKIAVTTDGGTAQSAGTFTVLPGG
jgi:hypothetical protein